VSILNVEMDDEGLNEHAKYPSSELQDDNKLKALVMDMLYALVPLYARARKILNLRSICFFIENV
jgi:hypothetical protein